MENTIVFSSNINFSNCIISLLYNKKNSYIESYIDDTNGNINSYYYTFVNKVFLNIKHQVITENDIFGYKIKERLYNDIKNSENILLFTVIHLNFK